jgi:hypothetical protein
MAESKTENGGVRDVSYTCSSNDRDKKFKKNFGQNLLRPLQTGKTEK